MACGSIAAAVAKAREIANKPVEVEVENFDELNQAIEAGANIVMLNTLALTIPKKRWNSSKTWENLVSELIGDVTIANLRYKRNGVDFVSMGALTKHIKAVSCPCVLSNNPYDTSALSDHWTTVKLANQWPISWHSKAKR